METGGKSIKSVKRKGRQSLFLAFVLFFILAFAAMCPTANAGGYCDGCPFDNFYNGTLHGGVYFDCKGWYQKGDHITETGTFENVPAGRQIVRFYPGIWTGTPTSGAGIDFSITINDNPTNSFTYNNGGRDACSDPPTCNIITTPQGCIVSETGCGCDDVRYNNAAPDIVTGNNTITFYTSEQIYQFALLTVYENASMPPIQYWIKEGHEYPDEGIPYYVYFNETANTGKIYLGSLKSAEYWNYGYPHLVGSPTLNGHDIGRPDVVRDNDYDYILYGWLNIPADYITAPSNEFKYEGFDNARLMVAVLVLNYYDPSNLTVTDISPESLIANWSNAINAKIVNYGKTARFFNVTLYANDEVVDVRRVENLGEGENRTVKLFWEPSATGSYVLNVTADVENVVLETDETNNSKTMNVEVTTANPPAWSNQSSNVSSIPVGGTIELRAQGIADVGLEKAILCTNETGAEIWENITDGRYGSPMNMASYYNYSVTHTSESDWNNQTMENVHALYGDIVLERFIGTVNIARDKPASASSFIYPDQPESYGPQKANDGVITTFWLSNYTKVPCWWKVNLTEITDICKIHITFSGYSVPLNFTVYTSNDGTTWTEKIDKGFYTEQVFTISNLDWSCRYINVSIFETFHSDYPNGYGGIHEFEAYGPGDYKSNGTLTSSMIETSNPIVSVIPEWNLTKPEGTSFSVNISVDNGVTWKNATNGTKLTWDYDPLNNRLKYKVLFETTDVNETPVLHDITMNYTTKDPVEGEWLWSKFTWQNASIPEGTTVGWKIYYEDMLGQTNCTGVKTFEVGAPGPAIELIREQANTTGLNQETTVRLVVWNTDSSNNDTTSLNLTEWIDPDWSVTDCGNCYVNTSTYIKWTLGDLARDNYTMVSYKIKAPPANSEVSSFKANCTYKYDEQDGSTEGSEFAVSVESGKAFFDFELDMDASTTAIDRDVPEGTEKTVKYTVTNVGDAAPCDTVFIELKINKTAWNVTCAYCDEFYNDTDYYYLRWTENGSSWTVQQTKVFNFTVNSCQPGYYNFASNGTYDPPANAFSGQIYYKMAGMSLNASPDPEEDKANEPEPEEPSLILTASKKHFAAINTHKSIYLPGEPAFIGIAVLNDEGHMVCDAGVTLTITDPGNKETVLSTSNGLINVSPECSVYGVTNLPDYYTNYTVGGVGTYVMNLTAVTADGIKSITDEFTVQNSVDFDVARDGPTRIYPPVSYVMNFIIKANKNYNGPISEYVPASFAITAQDGLTATTVGDTKRLTWNKNLVKGETHNIYYEFDAPDVSPYLFVLGALEIGGFKEARQWQIASDAPDTETLYVNGINNTYTDWTEVGDSPYLNNNNTSHIYTNFDENKEGEFSFANPSGSGTINSVTIFFECRQTSQFSGSEKFEPFLYDGSSWTQLTDVIPAEGDPYTWKSEDVSTMLDTWTKITDAEMYVVYQKVGGQSVETIYIRRAYLYVDYTPSADTTPPTYTNDGDNSTSTGSITEGAIVETHVYWADVESNLGKAVLRTNKTGSWTNESWHTFAGNAEWANITFDTTGHGGKTICWVHWANDTSNNWNTSMPTTAHCFDVLHVTKISQVLINDTNPDQGDSVKIEAKLEYDNGTAIADQNVSFYYDTSIINSDFTNSTGWATVLWDTTGVNNGTYKINATYSGNSSIYTGASYNNTREVEVVGIAEKIFVTNIETHFVRVTKTAGGVPNVVVDVNTTIFGSMLAGDNTTIYISLTLNNSEGTGPAEIKAVFTTNVSVVYGLLNGTSLNIIPGNYFELGPDTNEKALTNTTTKTFISTVAAGATVDYNAILTVPAGQAADEYSGIVELSW